MTPGCLNKKPYIDITWDQGSPEVMNFVLLKSTDNNPPKSYKTFTDGTTAYHDTTVTLNHTFKYQVTATFRNWTGTTAIVSATTPAKC